MMGRPLPLTPPTDGYCIDSRPHTPLRYQNDSPFVTTSRAGTGSTNHTKRHFVILIIPELTNSVSRSFTKSPSSQLETQSADDKQRNAEELLKQVPWFQPKLNREEVLQKLSKEDLGSFIIRESSTHTSCFALSVKVPKFNNPSGIAHYIIHRTPSQGFKIKVCDFENNLVTSDWFLLAGFGEGVEQSLFLSDSPHDNAELLPCTLKVPPPPRSADRVHFQGQHSSRGSSSPSPSLISKPTTLINQIELFTA
ncbi:hypothetical protein EB796_017592 [Bugula neritina]|uniref:SH2 domain-containing protein n=1 Tax=Bugula neritina TaxID=10212 RepID=A0A7J7JCU8_BUGNE|nr:hypothetical protein EB796_017592 [Bugula neritina]